VQIDQLGGQITMHQGFFKTISKEYNLFLSLVGRGQASLNEMDSRQQAWMQSQSKLQELESTKLRLTAELNDAQYQLTTNAISTADEIEALKAKILDIDEKLVNSKARRSIEIHAPEDGVIAAVVADPGQLDLTSRSTRIRSSNWPQSFTIRAANALSARLVGLALAFRAT
jgi:membrane fusion protein